MCVLLAASHCCMKLYRICPKCANPIAKRSVRLLQRSFDSLQAEQQVGRLQAKQHTDRTELRIASRAAGRHAMSRPADMQAAGKAEMVRLASHLLFAFMSNSHMLVLPCRLLTIFLSAPTATSTALQSLPNAAELTPIAQITA